MKHLNLKRNPINIAQNRFKVRRLEGLSETYLPPAMYTHRDNVKRAFVYGKNQYIGAVTPNTMDSAKFSRQIVKQADPDYLILGGFNNYTMGLLLDEKPSLVLRQEDLFCKDLLSRYMSDVEPQEAAGGVFHPQNKIFYQLDDRHRQIWTNDYMTAGINALENEDSKVLFGSPSTTVTIEDLMIRIDLKQLEGMYFQVLSTLRTTSRDQFIYANRILDVWVRQLAKEKFKNTLFTKTMLYQAAVFRSCAKLGKSNLILCDRFFVDEIRHFMEKSSTEASSLYRGYLMDKDHPDCENYRRTLQLPRAEILKKFYLLSCLVDRSALEWIQRGHNVMRDSVFSKMFPRMSSSQLQKNIHRDAQMYQQALLDVQTQFITNNLKFGPIQIPRRLQLQEQLEAMESREPDFPAQFQVHCQRKDITEDLQRQKVWEIMEQMLRSEKRLRDLQLLLEFKEGKYSQQNITLFSKVLGETKIKTGSPIKLPLFHFKNFSGYFKDVMRDIYLENEYGLKKVRLPQEPQKATTETGVTSEQIEEMLRHKIEGGMGQSSDPEQRPHQQTLSAEQAIKQWSQSQQIGVGNRRKAS